MAEGGNKKSCNNNFFSNFKADILHCSSRVNLLKQITQMKKNRSEADILMSQDDLSWRKAGILQLERNQKKLIFLQHVIILKKTIAFYSVWKTVKAINEWIL